MSENTFEQKLSQAQYKDEKENNLELTVAEMEIFNKLANNIVEMKNNYPFYNPQDELRFYEKEKKQYLTHIRNKSA